MESVTDRKYEKTGFEEWGGYMEAKKQKLKEQFENGISEEQSFIEEGSNIFQGISIFVNGYTNPPVNELKRLMMLHGGTYHHYYSRKSTTHIIATNLPYSKIRELKDEKVVKPEWITESVKAGKLLPYYNYLLYSASSRNQKTLDFGTKFDKKINNVTEQFSENCPMPEIKETEEESYGNTNSERKEDCLLEQTCDKDLLIEKVFIPNEESLSTELFQDSSFGSIINQAEEFSSETSRNLQRTIDDSKCRKHQQLSYHMPKRHTEQSESLKAGAPNFISEFYNHSRLHHISIAKSNFQIYVSELRNRKNVQFMGREKLKELYQNDVNDNTSATKNFYPAMDNQTKIFMHIDMDCFFASVSLLKYPHLKGKPVAVTHSKTGVCHPLEGSDMEYERQYYKTYYMNDGNEQLSSDHLQKRNIDSEVANTDNPNDYYGSTSEIASCNYHARKYGIYNGMFVGEAKKLCPELQMIPYDFEGYETVSKLLYDTVASYTLDIQAVSCDEMYIDCTSVLTEITATPLQFTSVLRREIEEKTGCTASAGLGNNLLLARLATKTAKPNGQYFVEPHFSEEFMKQQLVKDLPGIGHVLESRLKTMRIKTCEDLQNVSLGKLQSEFGMKTGKMFYEYCRGIDFREIKTDNKRKSVSAEINYGMRFQQLHEVKSFLKELAEEVQTRLQKINMRGKSITLKLKVRKENAPVEPAKYMGHGICDNITKTLQLGSATNNSVAISRASIMLLQKLRSNPGDIRGIGIQVGRLEQLSAKNTSSNKMLLNFIQKTDKSGIEKKQDSTLSPSKLHKAKTSRSFSEVDPEVFASLPEDLQHEIMEFYNGSNTTSIEDIVQPQQIYFPSTSSVNANRNFTSSRIEKNIKSNFSAENQTFDLPNLSQVDHEVLAALPDELKYEIMEAYNYKAGTEEHTRMQHPGNKLMSMLKQPPYSKSKTVKAKRSPVKLQKGNNCKNISAKQSSNKWSNIIHSVVQKPVFAENGINSHHVSEETKTVAESCTELNLCGAVTIDEVKNLLTEWVTSSKTPEEEDVALFSQYIVDIIMEKNLEKLNRIVKYFYRLIKKTESTCWQKSYLDIITAMQSIMLQIFGSTLKIETDF